MQTLIRPVPVRGVRLLLILIAVFVVTGCAASLPVTPAAAPQEESVEVGEAVAPASNLADECVEVYDEEIDYFPDKVTTEISDGFQIEYHNHFKVVTVTDPWQDADERFQYVLVQCGTPAPEGYEEATVIEVPVDEVIALSTTYLPHLDALGVVDSLVGLDSHQWTNNEAVRARIEAGDVAQVGGGAEINLEVVLDLEPDVVMAYGIGIPEYDAHPQLLEAGVPVVLNGDFVEQDPLGRTEWLKFTSLFFNREATAQERFDEVAAAYRALSARADEVENRPTVLVSSVYNGTWWVSAGNSYTARLLSDAGADYIWADEGDIASIGLDFESVLDEASNADYWINPDQAFWHSVDDVLASDERYADFQALSQGNLYNNNAIVNEHGGNDFFESGAANPHIVLADLIKIFHPELMPDHELVYYQPIE